MYGRPVVYPGSMAMLSRPRSHQSITSTDRSANWVGLVSARLSYSKIRPFFSATKILPFGANSMLVGWLNPLITICSWKPAGRTPVRAGLATRGLAGLKISGTAGRSVGGVLGGTLGATGLTTTGAEGAAARLVPGRTRPASRPSVARTETAG